MPDLTHLFFHLLFLTYFSLSQPLVKTFKMLLTILLWNANGLRLMLPTLDTFDQSVSPQDVSQVRPPSFIRKSSMNSFLQLLQILFSLPQFLSKPFPFPQLIALLRTPLRSRLFIIDPRRPPLNVSLVPD